MGGAGAGVLGALKMGLWGNGFQGGGSLEGDLGMQLPSSGNGVGVTGGLGRAGLLG